MSVTHVSRRTFLKTAAVTGAAVSAGALSFGSWQEAQADTSAEATLQIPTLCNACSSKCGMMATLDNNRLYELKGQPDHPYSKGHLCGRGHGFAQLAYSKERVTEPLKRNQDGSFTAISWDQALNEIGKSVKEIREKHGPESISFVNDPRPTGKTWGKNFMNALGNNNVYTHAASCNLSKESGFEQVIGTGAFSADISNSKLVVFIGRSYGDGIRPSSVMQLSKAAEGSTKIVIIDPRLSNSGIFADQWISIKPGTDLALLLAVAHVLVTEDLYDHQFIEEQTIGFEEWAATLSEYTPAWAEEITTVSAEVITELARELAKAAPASVIEPSWRAAFGCSYQNSFDCARIVCLINALLGNYNQKGGALITESPSPGKVDKAAFPTPEKPEAKRLGDIAYPLAASSAGSAVSLEEQAEEGRAHAIFFYTSNAMHSYGNPAHWYETMEKVDLKVAIEVQMSETALHCDYVLPECTYIERTEIPDWIGGKTWNVALRSQVIDVVHPETKPADEIFNLLAKACGVGETFTYSAEELGRAQVEAAGLNYDELKEVGILPVEGSPFAYGTLPEWNTPTKKLQFTSEEVAKVGRNPLVVWTPPLVEPKEDEFRLIGGKQGIHSHSMTTNVDALSAISHEYNMERIWINADVAKEYGIEDGDEVEISNEYHTGVTRARVTQRIRKDCLFLPSHYGQDSSYLTNSYKFGICAADFTPFHTEPNVGSIMSQEVAVKLKKVSK